VDSHSPLDLSAVVHREPGPRRNRPAAQPPEAGTRDALDHELIESAGPALGHAQPVTIRKPIANVNRAVGALLSNAVTREYGAEGLPDGTIEAVFTGSAGQSFGAWLASGISFVLLGDANDYAGKGLSGGTLAIAPPATAAYAAADSVIAGNTLLYGATKGRAFFSGRVGERFAVRNSGAVAVVESVGDHGCEYMTGGRVAVLGRTGRNFGAGMSGGIAWVNDVDGRFARRCNRDLVDLERVPDGRALWELVAEHFERTGSLVAEEMLGDWDGALKRFLRVMPRDYRRAMEREEPVAAAAGALDEEPAVKAS
jgi:glutamate synthase (NADPH/NADH) large chain/glutamate synthase (ferredoxin)